MITFFSALFLLAGAHDPAQGETFGPAMPESVAVPQSGNVRPVMIGLDGAEFDACGAVGRVAGLNPQGDNFLSVRERPETDSFELDQLAPRTLVWLCEADEDWQGIVYASGDFQDLGDCRVGTPIAVPRAYKAPCQSGWVHGKYLELVAG